MRTLHLAVLALGFAVTAEAGIQGVAEDSHRKVVTDKYIDRDFAPLLMPKTEFIGYIGPDFQRLKIHFGSVTRDPTSPAVYHIIGNSEVKTNHCDLDGTITVTKLMGAKSRTLRDELGKDLGVTYRGSLYGRYDIKENGPANICGGFHGTMRLDWYIDRHDTLLYDDVDAVSDGYNNNQYEGSWTMSGGKVKEANWGEYRVPKGAGLDCGAAEFSPCKLFKDKGWADYQFQKWKP